MAKAYNKPDGLAVLGFFLNVTGNEENEDFKKISEALSKIVRKNSYTNISPGKFK